MVQDHDVDGWGAESAPPPPLPHLIPRPAAGSHARAVFEYAKALVFEAGRVMMPHSGQPVALRVGIHTGPVVSGVIGSRMPKFCLYVWPQGGGGEGGQCPVCVCIGGGETKK